MDVEAEDDEYLHWKKLTAKGQTKITVPLSYNLELKLRTGRQGKCVGAAPSELYTATKEPQTYNFISNEVWFHLANYIAPEDVKNYALICTQSAHSVTSRLFWFHMYSRYCQHARGRSNKWVLGLPEELQIYRLRDCDRNILKQKVIQAFYRCYPPLQKRLLKPYSLEALEGRIYISSWHKLITSKHLMCYKFLLSITPPPKIKSVASKTVNSNKIAISGAVADNWECLADETNNNYIKETHSFNNNLEGAFILLIASKRPPPPLTVVSGHDSSPLRFAAGRVLLSSDMKSQNLELDFISAINEQIVTVKYLEVSTCKVLPWWHPNFGKFLSYEQIDDETGSVIP